MLNSFLISSLVKTRNREDKEALKQKMNCPKVNIPNPTISGISLLYQYTNPPPLAYGSPAPKAAETIIRSKQYNMLPNNGRYPNKNDDRQYWTEADGDYPSNLNEPTCNISLPAMRQFSTDFLKRWHVEIDETIDEVIDDIYNENADVLTKGRQTWDPIKQRSVTSAEAYKETLSLYKDNIGQCNFNMVDWISAWSKMFDKKSIIIKEKTITKEVVKTYHSKRGTVIKKERTKVKEARKHIEGEDQYNYLMTIATEFCAYLKSKERSKLERRAIASANMVLRMFFEIIEKFHLSLSRKIKGSTIAQGGIEKQHKITNSLGSLTQLSQNLLATEDATKWNECLAPSGFLIMHEVLLSVKSRAENNIHIGCNKEYYEVLREIFHTGIYLLSKKRIYIGQGHVLEDGVSFSRHRWFGVDPSILNERTRRWYDEIKADLDSRECLYSPFGMLMGMLNAGSTTYGLVATTAMSDKLSCVRSSDDSITKFTGRSTTAVWENVLEMYWRYKLIGINISMKKTRFFRWPFGEYTSWYLDEDFSAQYGVEISSIRPKGDTPHTDFHSAAVETNVALRELRINNVGAEMMLGLKISNTRRLWRIVRESNATGVSQEIALLADGGNSPWHSTNSSLSEIGLKFHLAIEEKDLNYLYKVCNPNNPFSSKETEKLSYSHELGAVVNMSIDVPRNVFCYIKRPNKTLKTNFKVKEKAEMDACKFLVDLLETIEPSFCILKPGRGTLIKDYLNTLFGYWNQLKPTIDDPELKLKLDYISNFAERTFGFGS